jgi:hypothetical protein
MTIATKRPKSIKASTSKSVTKTKAKTIKSKTKAKTIKSKLPSPETIGWILDSIKRVLGYEDIRRGIIKVFYPKIANSKYIKTFDAFIDYENGKTEEDKIDEILDYCDNIIDLKGRVIFTATNIQEDVFDNETHYQMYIVDNENKIVYAIDPARDSKKKSGIGIYHPTISLDTIKPFFMNEGYKFQFIELSNPAQISMDDVFCQSWLLYILFEVLRNGYDMVNIPDTQIEKYEMLLNFYKDLLQLPNKIGEDKLTFSEYLNNEYNEVMRENNKTIKNVNPSEIMNSMSPEDMEDK